MVKVNIDYFLNFDDDDDDGPICTLFVGPPIAIVSADAFSCDVSVNVCCRKLNSFNLSVVNWDGPDVVVVGGKGGGGLFSISSLTLSIHSIFKSGFTTVFASADEVDDDVDGGLASKIKWKFSWCSSTVRSFCIITC